MWQVKLVLMQGYPASGKSTVARQIVSESENTVRVSRDDFRSMLFNQLSGLTQEQEELISIAQKQAVIHLLRAGQTVIIDDTNLNPRTVAGWRRIATQENVPLEYLPQTTPLEVCLERNASREPAVAESAIHRFASRYPMRSDGVAGWTVAKPVQPQPRMSYVNPPDAAESVILVDLDGTLAHMGDRSPYDTERVDEDLVDEHVLTIIAGLAAARHVDRVIFISGRSELARNKTESWLAQHVLPALNGIAWELHMRAAQDSRNDAIVKYEIFDSEIRPQQYRIIGVFDDRNQVVKMWREIGLKVLQVQDGDF